MGEGLKYNSLFSLPFLRFDGEASQENIILIFFPKWTQLSELGRNRMKQLKVFLKSNQTDASVEIRTELL